jgi:D-aspartate ligase
MRLGSVIPEATRRSVPLVGRRGSRNVERWERSQRRGVPSAIVMGGSINGLSFVRSLGRRGIPVLVLDAGSAVGMHSHYGYGVPLSREQGNPDQWLEFLRDLAERVPEPPVLFATSDQHMLFLAQHTEDLRDRFRFLVPSPNVVETIVNKRRQYALAGSAGIPIPATFFPDSLGELRAVATEISYPCILKPESYVGRRKIGKKVVNVASPDALEAEYQRLVEPGTPFMVQEVVPGEDSNLYGYLAFWDADGEERAWLTKRKLRQYPLGFGDGCLQVTTDAPEVADLSRRLLRAFGYRGFVVTEFKWDERDQMFRLIEVNPRTSGGNQMAISAGIDFPWIGYQYLVGRSEGAPSVAFKRGVRFVWEDLDIRSFLDLRREGRLTLGPWLRSFRGAQARGLWARDDPIPFLLAMGSLGRRGFMGAKRRLTPPAAIRVLPRSKAGKG